MKGDLEYESVAWLSGDERDGFGTRRTPRPTFARFDTWSSVGWSRAEVDLLGRLSVERCMGPRLIVPNEERSEFPAKASAALWNHDLPRCFIFHGSDESLDYSDASVLPSRAESRTDSLSPTPALEAFAPEDTVLVANKILGRRVISSDRPSKKRAHCDRLGPVREDSEAHGAPRVVRRGSG